MSVIRSNIILWSFVMVCLTVFGCRNGEELANPDELPDINKQLRPYVTVASTKVRTGPGPQFRATGEVPPRAKVHVVGRDGDWVLIVSKKGNIPGSSKWLPSNRVKAKRPQPAIRQSAESMKFSQIHDSIADLDFTTRWLPRFQKGRLSTSLKKTKAG